MAVRDLSEEQQEHVWTHWREGESLRKIGRNIGVSAWEVRRYVLACGGVRPRPRKRPQRQLTSSERELIAAGLTAGDSCRRIGEALGRCHTTISREVARNGGREHYRASRADAAGVQRRCRRKPSKLAVNQALAAQVTAWLELEWSPEQIAHRLPIEHPDDASMRVSHECIYLALYQPKRKGLKRGLHRRLRSGRQVRNPKQAKTPTGRGQLREITPIHERPAEVETRQQLGHWEGDLVMGRRPSAVATLVERRTRLLRLVKTPQITAGPVRQALASDLQQIPAQQRLTLTWDRGKEMAEHKALRQLTGTHIYFCDRRSPWQRGTNENTNRLLRQYLPKKTDLSVHTQKDLDSIASRLNNRPRKILGWNTPAEAYAEATVVQ